MGLLQPGSGGGPTITHQSGKPSSPAEGDLTYDTDVGAWFRYNGSSWDMGAGEWSDVSSSITLEGTATAGSATYSSREVAKYVRGDTVKYVGFIQLSSVGGINGQVIIAGVDAANEDVGSANFPVGHILTSGGASNRWAQAWWSINSDFVRGRYEGNWWTNNDIDDDTSVYFYLEYRKA